LKDYFDNYFTKKRLFASVKEINKEIQVYTDLIKDINIMMGKKLKLKKGKKTKNEDDWRINDKKKYENEIIKLKKDKDLMKKKKYNFEEFLNKEKYSDITIKIKGENFYGHKIIMNSKSEYFRNMINFNEKSKDSDYEFNDFSYETMNIVMNYIYCDLDFNIENMLNEEIIIDCLFASDILMLYPLKKKIENLFKNYINLKNYFEIVEINKFGNFPILNEYLIFYYEKFGNLLCFNDLIYLKKLHNFKIIKNDIYSFINEIELNNFNENYFKIIKNVDNDNDEIYNIKEEIYNNKEEIYNNNKELEENKKEINFIKIENCINEIYNSINNQEKYSISLFFHFEKNETYEKIYEFKNGIFYFLKIFEIVLSGVLDKNTFLDIESMIEKIIVILEYIYNKWIQNFIKIIDSFELFNYLLLIFNFNQENYS
jgi:hypothetical protein